MKPYPVQAGLEMATATERKDPSLRKATLLCLAALTVMAGATLAPSLPALENHFVDTANSELLTRLVLTLPALFIALFAPLAGVVFDRFGLAAGFSFAGIFLLLLATAVAAAALWRLLERAHFIHVPRIEK